MRRTISARWRDWSGEGIQHLVLVHAEEGIEAEAVVLGTTEEGVDFGARYRILCDALWRVRSVEAGVVGDERVVSLTSDCAGHWFDASGAPLQELDGAIDVDLPITPFTNTLPIRRLRLGAGESADIRVAYITLPEYTITMDPQRYVCLEPLRRYRYESSDSDFVREIEVDDDGLVVTYPGLFTRLREP